jgi:hypothetical protein
MSVLQQVIWCLSVLQLFGLVGVLILRRHYQRMPLFTLYAGGSVLSGVVLGLHYTRDAWMVQQAVMVALRFGVALELIYRIFGAFPAAAATARRVMFVILVATALTAISLSTPAAVYTRSHAEAIPRLAAGAAWTLTALAVLVLWYRLPLAPLPRAILMGYAPYLLIFTISLSLLFDASTERLRPWLGYMDLFAFIVLVNYWIRVAWRTAPEATMSYPPEAAVVPAVPVPRQSSPAAATNA